MRERPSRIGFVLAGVLFVGVWAWVGVAAGDDLPGHFGSDGSVTRYDSKWSTLGVLGGVALVVAVAFGSVRRLIPRIPGRAINLPTRAAHAYWTAPAQRARFDALMSEDLEWLGAATLVLLAWMLGLSGIVSAGSVNVWLLAGPTALYLVGILGYSVYAFVGGRYRVPE